ncbi:MAG: IS1 family transposase [Gemmatimonadota bacterium]|nr:IS1 family transposase [Gemmatimonadota bacterium]
MNKLSVGRRTHILAALVDGNSIRATCRITDTAKGTVLKLLVDAGRVCRAYQQAHLVNLPCKRLQVDEIWSFVNMKERTISSRHAGMVGIGDAWTFVALDADTKLVPSFLVTSLRGATAATLFLRDLESRLAHRVQLTTDGHGVYLRAVEDAFGWNRVDYSMLVKIYGQSPEGERRYSPAVCLGIEKHPIMGNPDPDHVSTSYVERQNLTMRMSMRCFTRLTNAFSKKLENLGHAVSLHFMHYNFARIHKTLRMSPAMAAGVDQHLWTVPEIAEMIGSYASESN